MFLTQMEQAEGSQTSTRSELPIIWKNKLPPELSIDILSRLPVTSLLQCKLVSKLWNASVKHPQLAVEHFFRAAELDPFIVIFSDWPNCKLQILYKPDPSSELILKTLNLPFQPELPNFEFVGSCNGLLCLYNTGGNDPVFLYNPFLSQLRRLPRLVLHRAESEVCRVVFGFGFHRLTQEYKVIKIVYHKQRLFDFVGGDPEAFVLTVGNAAEWRALGKIELGIGGPTSEALVEGKLHWLGLFDESYGVQFRGIVSFDLETEELSDVPQPNGGGLNWAAYHLMELKGRLAAVVPAGDGANEIWAMAEYGVGQSWRREVRIGIFVPREFPWSMMPPARAKWNGTLKRGFRVLSELNNGEILFLHSNRSLACFNPTFEEFRELEIEGLPLDFQAILLFGTLISVDIW